MIFCVKIILKILRKRQRGAMVARLTPDQNVACSNHAVVNTITNSYVLITTVHFKIWLCVHYVPGNDTFSLHKLIFCVKFILKILTNRQRGAMVACLTPDQKVACSNHVVVNPINNNYVIITTVHFKIWLCVHYVAGNNSFFNIIWYFVLKLYWKL